MEFSPPRGEVFGEVVDAKCFYCAWYKVLAGTATQMEHTFVLI